MCSFSNIDLLYYINNLLDDFSILHVKLLLLNEYSSSPKIIFIFYYKVLPEFVYTANFTGNRKEMYKL